MKSLIKLILGLSGLVVVILLAVVITVATLDPNDHKDWISKQALEKTGRTLILAVQYGAGYLRRAQTVPLERKRAPRTGV